MSRRASRSASNCCSSCSIVGLLVGQIALAVLIIGAVFDVKQVVATQKELLSRVTDNTPISGFYGPGSWWAWLITLGMTHGHMAVNLLATAELAEEWDYDLIGASGYTIAATIDLIVKSRAIAKLGDAAAESPLLPALLCAERVVSIGTGSSIFTLLTALYFIGRPAALRRAAIALIPLLFGLVASWFTPNAHLAISWTAPVLWCSMHYGQTPAFIEDHPLTHVDFPASIVGSMANVSEIYVSRGYWVAAGVLAVVAIVAIVVVQLVNPGPGRNLMRTLRAVAFCVIPLAGASVFPPLAVAYLVIIGAVLWLSFWVFLWGPLYILAFFPEMGHFPLTGMSVRDMDQLAALLGVGFIAVFRSGRRISKALHRPPDSSTSTHELHPLLDPSQDTTDV